MKKRIIKFFRHIYELSAHDSIEREKYIQATIKYTLNDIRNLQTLLPLRPSLYIPASTYSLSLSATVTVLNDIVFHNRQTIVELGAGISTFYIGQLLKQRQQGHIYSVESDETWYTMYQGLLEKEGLQDWVTLIYAPLTPSPHYLIEPCNWYDADILHESIPQSGIDVLIVDGPWRMGGRATRYPAVPFFNNALAEDWLILLDDVRRPDEQATLQAWQDSLSQVFRTHGDFSAASHGSSTILFG